jgi:hypothetical protein
MIARRPGRTRVAGGFVWGTLALAALTACGGPPPPSAAVRSSLDETLSPLTSPPVPSSVRPGLLINQPTPFGPSAVKRIRRLPDVNGLALIGYGQVWVYDQQLPTATIDPVSYRPFTPADTRTSDAVWSAIADGKALVGHVAAARAHLALDTTVPAGWSSVRIAGLATTVPGIDMIVGSKVGERIGVPYGNGLVVAISGDPDRMMARIGAILGAGATIRRIVTGPDAPDPAANAPILPAVTPSTPPSPPPAAPVAPVAPGHTTVLTPAPVAPARPAAPAPNGR